MNRANTRLRVWVLLRTQHHARIWAQLWTNPGGRKTLSFYRRLTQSEIDTLSFRMKKERKKWPRRKRACGADYLRIRARVARARDADFSMRAGSSRMPPMLMR